MVWRALLLSAFSAVFSLSEAARAAPADGCCVVANPVAAMTGPLPGLDAVTDPAPRWLPPLISSRPSLPLRSDRRIPLRDRMDLAIAHEVRMTRDPATGDVPRERLLLALEQAESIRAAMARAAIPGVLWQERGPNNVSGRSRAILIDPNTPSGLKVFAAGVGGGLWVTTDISAPAPNWTPINDLFSNLAITTLAASPANPLQMYFGTGEGYFNADAIRGNGIWKSIDGGASWSQLGTTANSNFHFVQKIVVTSAGVVLAATQSGVRRSADGGSTWTKVLGAGMGITGANSNLAWDVEIAANGDVYASLDGSIHKSVDGGATFGAAQTLPIGGARIELATAPNDANYVYAVVESANVVAGILRSTNGGTSWASRAEPNDADPGIPDTDFSRSQAWYDLSIAVDPNNRDRLFVGAVDLFASSDGAGTWTQISHWYGGFSEPYVHADQHLALFQSGNSNVALFANDGGIYRTTNATAAQPTIEFKGTNLNITQFYATAMHPSAGVNYFLAGAQDNGSHQFNSPGIDSTAEVTGGDGAFTHIDQDQPQFQFTSYVYNDFYRSTNSGATWTNISTGGGLFISPTDYDNLGNRLYGHQGSNNYLRWDNPQSGNTFATVAVAGFGGQVAAVTVSPNTANRVFFGIDNGRVFRVDNAHTATPVATNISTGLPSAYVSSIEVQAGNDNHLLVTYANYGVVSVWESTNGGTSWTAVEGSSLPDMPVRWALFNPSNGDQALIATEVGVWSTTDLNGAATEWNPSVTGLANVRVDMLQYRTSDQLVVAATHGRGLYSSNVFVAPSLRVAGNAVLGGNGNAVLDPNECNRFNVTVANDGGIAATSASGVLSTSTPGLTVSQANSGYGSIAGNSSAANATEFRLSSANTLACGSQVSLSLLMNYGAGQSATLPFSLDVGTPVFGFSQNFDAVTAPALPAGWTTASTGTAPAAFATTSAGASSAPNAVFTSGSGATSTNSLITPAIAIPAGGARGPQLTFQHTWNFEFSGSYWDGGVLELTTNGGGTWNDVTSPAVGGSFASGGYVGTLDASNPLGARPAWGNGQPVFVSTVLDLPATLNGQTLQFRFRAGWDSSTANAGANWVIDDVRLRTAFTCSAGAGVCAGPPTQLQFLQQPGNTAAGAAIAPAVSVRLLDASGVLTDSTATVNLAIASNPGGGTLSGTTSIAAVAGVASFPNLSIQNAGNGYTLQATSTGLTGATSSAFNIVAAAAAQLNFAVQPSNTRPGSAIAPPVTVRVEDAFGNLTSSTATVSMAIGSNPGSATLGGSTSAAAVAGVSTFANLTLSAPGNGYTLVASSGGLGSDTSATFNATNLATTTTITSDAPDPSTAGQAYTVQVQVSATGVSPTGQISVNDGGDAGAVSCGPVTLTAGAPGVSTASCQLSSTVVGARTLTASYAPGIGFAASSDTESHQVNAVPTYTVGGNVSGLAAGNSVVLRNNGGNDLTVAANGAFTFTTPVTDGAAYAVTVFTQPTTPNQTCVVSNGSGNIAGANVSNVTVTCTTNTYTVGGNVSGLAAGNSVVLRNNGGNDLTVAANGAFTFTTPVTDGAAYAVTVFNQPTTPNQTCVVSNGSGNIAGANVSNVTVTCTTNTYTVGGNVSGLAAGNSVVLRNNGGNDLTVAANGAFTFTTALADESAYAVTVFTQPTTPNQSCVVTNGSGTLAGANVSNVTVTCTTTTYTVGGNVSGLAAGNSVVLRNNGGNDLTVAANGAFTFTTAITDGNAYAVTVLTQPTTPNQTCVVTNGSGNIAGANVSNVTVTCTTNTYTVGGNVSGLAAGNSVVLRNNGGNDLTVAANGAFTFTTAITDGNAYAVTVFTQPTTPNQTCAVTNGSGNIAGANVSNVAVACTTNTYTVGGNVSGLAAGNSVVLRNNGGNDLTVAANGAFTFTTAITDGNAYAVTVFTQPTTPNQTCVVTNGSGNIAGANVINVAVACTTNTYTIGGTVAGLAAGNSVVLRNNGGNDLTVAANGAFTFTTALTDESAYVVTVFTQPTTPNQTCAVTNGSGNIAGANVTNVTVTCTTTTYTVGGTVAGLTAGNSVVLRNNGGNDLTVAANGAFTFTTPIADGNAYAVSVFTQPSAPTQNCVVTNGSGTIAGANVSNVTVTCTTTTFTVGGNVSGLAAGNNVVLRNNGGNDLTVAANGAFTFTTALTNGAAYAVTVFTQPTTPNQTCVVTNGSGNIAGANVANVAVACTTNTYTIGGTVAGLAAGNSVVLRNNGGNDLTVAANGAFTFTTALADESAYAVTVFTQPTTPNQTCVVTNGSGTLAGANVSNVAVACTTNSYTIGGTISGLPAGDNVTLRNNGGNDLIVSANGVFTFTTPVIDGGAYVVTVQTQPTTPNRICLVSSGSGSVAGANVSSVVVDCVTDAMFSNGFE